MDKIIIHSTDIAAPVVSVYNSWISEQGIQSFFAQNCAVEYKIGGKFEMYFLMDNEEGLRGAEGCKIISYLPNKMFSFSWNAPPEYPNVRNHEHKAWVVLLFDEIKRNHTKVTLHHLGWLPGVEWEQVYDYFDKAWPNVLGNLKKSLEDK